MKSRWSLRARFCTIALFLAHSVDSCQPNCQTASCLQSCSLVQPTTCAADQIQAGPATDRDLLKLLGGNTNLRDLQKVGDGSGVSSSRNLDCIGPESECRWRNAAPGEAIDQFDWGTGQGSPNAERWSLLTGSDILPHEPYFLTASNPRSAEQRAVLLSDTIGCQEADGRLNFKYWTSLSRLPDQQPKIRVCYRHLLEAALVGCQQVIDIGIDPMTASVIIPGPITRPFQLAISVEHFINEPEGGFAAIGDIKYTAEVAKTCGVLGNNVDDLEKPVPVKGKDLVLLRPKSPFTKRPRPHPRPEVKKFIEKPMVLKPTKKADVDSCNLLTCDFGATGNFCHMNPLGNGANGVGEREGWRVLPANRNPTNPLTGILIDGANKSDGPFAVASFPDPRQEPEEENLQFSLESPLLQFTESHYLTFQRYLATEGIQLLACRDAKANECFWKSSPLVRGVDQAQRNRAWTTELIRIPEGSYKLFLLARYDGSRRFNAGQIGLGYMRLFRDAQLNTPLC